MKNISNLFKLLLLSLFFLMCSYQSFEALGHNHERIGLADTPYTFSAEKVQQSSNAFYFVRSFVDYFYLLVAQNKGQLYFFKTFSKFKGWCVGDAHAENFGFILLEDGSTKFTVNDIDDFGPCPLALDLYRFMMSSYVYNENLDLRAIFDSYFKGLNAEPFEVPTSLKEMRELSLKHAKQVNPKKVMNSKLVRTELMLEVETLTSEELRKTITRLYPSSQLLDMVKVQKKGGGSGGLTRYEALLQIESSLVHLEFKQQIDPSLAAIATSPLPPIPKKISEALKTEQGPNASKLYGYAKIQNLEMLIRPIFWGNLGVSLEKHSETENTSIINYEAYTLGKIHREQNEEVKNLNQYIQTMHRSSFKALQNDIHRMGHFMKQKYQSLR